MDGNGLSSESNESFDQPQLNGLDAKGDEQLTNSQQGDDHRADNSPPDDGQQPVRREDDKSNEVSLANDLKSESNERTLPEDAESSTVPGDQKSSDQLVNGLEKTVSGQQEDDQSSNYESLNEASLCRADDKEMSSADESGQRETDQTNQNETSQNASEFVELFGNPDLLKRIVKKGEETSVKPERNCEVLINLEARNQATGELIESECEQHLSIMIGDFDVAHGVDLALLTMYKGEVAEILIKPLFGYGAAGKSPDVPPNCFLLYKVELLKITWPEEMVCGNLDRLMHYFQMTKRKKERGNFFFKRQEFTIALHCYVKSGEILDFLGQEMVNLHQRLTDYKSKMTFEKLKSEIDVELTAINELSIQYMKIKLDVFNNLALVNLKVKQYSKALEFVNNALRIEPNDKKALYRKSIILSRSGSVEEAVHTLEAALKIDPNNETFRIELGKLKIKRSKEIEEEKALYTKMLQPKKKKVKKGPQNSGQHLNYLTTGLVLGGLVLGGVLLYRKFAKS